MIERLVDLEGRVQRTRAALESLAGRAGILRARVEETRNRQVAAERPSTPSGPETKVSSETSALASSLDRLTQAAWIPVGLGADAREGDDGRFVSDAWEIALISEEGK